MFFRAVLVVLFVLMAGVNVVRTAAVAALAEEQHAKVETVWPSHPEAIRSVSMRAVGEAAGAVREPPTEALKHLEQLAKAEPLATEPLLVHSALAQREGDFQRAERLLVRARDRNPRSAGARFLLADLYFRTGRVLRGLGEMSVLGRLIPGAMEHVAPSLAAYATTTGATLQLRRVLLEYPELQPVLLNQLAENPRNADLILAIAKPNDSGEAPPAWQQKLLTKLVEQGAYARAHAIWARLSKVSQEDSRGLFNPAFDEKISAPPPFNWTLASSGSGVAEPAGGGLRVLYFGRDDVTLASQLMLLAPGPYRLQMILAGQAGKGPEIAWAVTCLPIGSRVLELSLGARAVGDPIEAEFVVPAQGCPAQRLELKGVGQEFPKSADFRISGLQLTRVSG